MADERGAERVWLDGRLEPLGRVAVSPFDHGVTVGDGVFETLQVIGGVPFAARRHLLRLRRSAAGLGLEVPVDDEGLRSAMRSTVEANGIDRGRLRLTVTGGVSPLGSDRGQAGATVIVATGDLAEWPATTAVAIVPWPRNERSAVAGLKTTSYAENVVALAHAHERGASEAIFANTVGDLCEGTGSNIFVGIDGRLITPPLSSGCLAGITRELVIEALARGGIPVATDVVAIERLASVDEAFLTSSTRDVQAIDAVDGAALPAPGPLTQAAAAAFADLLASDLDP